VKAWDHGVPMEPGVWKQVDNLAAVPGVERIAIMPDAHIGNGACVGSAILTRDIVIPAAVGVDIGCFDGDTRVPLLDSTQCSLRDLARSDAPIWVYSIDCNGRVAPGRAVARLTRRNAPLVRVLISGGDDIICTPDHEFMLSDGTYRAAEVLRFNDSLMPLYHRWQTRDGYESVANGQRLSRMTHELVFEAFNGPIPVGSVVHHRNGNQFDNRPENLELMTAAEHSLHHRQVGRKIDNADPEFQRARLAGIRRAMADPDKRAQRAELGTRNITRYMQERPEHFAEAVVDNGRRGAPTLAAFNVSPCVCSECGELQPNPAALRWHKHRAHAFNHKVLSVTALDRRADVYCLQVEGHHNFALAAGVFVHNCGMIAAPLRLRRSEMATLGKVRAAIEQRVPVGRTNRGQKGDRGAWGEPPKDVLQVWHSILARGYLAVTRKHKELEHPAVINQLGTLGTGNHFLEVCIELESTTQEDPPLWLMLHSGSRGVGNRIGQWFTRRARADTEHSGTKLPDPELGFFSKGSVLFDDYLEAARWAQEYAWQNRMLMFRRAMDGIAAALGYRVEYDEQRLTHCHHNYVATEEHFGRPGLLTRKGAVNAARGVMGIIPGSMGAKSYITRGKGNPEALHTSSHGAGRVMSRGAARRSITLQQHLAALAGVECRTDADVIDESPACYKPIDAVMAAQADLTEPVVALKQIIVVKG
jgi:RNA-splicing ligase RtcB